MKHTIKTSLFLVLMLIVFASTSSYASEVTGNLSSNGAATSQGTAGPISGTVVSSGSSGSSLAGGGGVGGGGSEQLAVIYPSTHMSDIQAESSNQNNGGTSDYDRAVFTPTFVSVVSGGRNEGNAGNSEVLAIDADTSIGEVYVPSTMLSDETPQAAAVSASGLDVGFGSWMILLLALLVIGSVIYSYTNKDKSKLSGSQGRR